MLKNPSKNVVSTFSAGILEPFFARMAKFFGCIQIGEYTRAISEKRGKFHKELKPGCHCLPWFCGYQIVGRVSMKTHYVVVRCDSKTKDDVFVTVVASIHYGVLDVPDKNNAKKAFYVHSDPKSLIEAHSFSAVKTAISSYSFDELFEKKDDLAVTVNKKLTENISADYGFGNFKTIVLDIAPDEYAKRIIRLTNAAPKMAVALTGATFPK
ncbi:Band 7/SPFH domain superfamily [Arabidopsis suecica]|uniref:Band 7/SPFH domain superfamily n=1 Tax=Arabidopsis suecica TaxID=45249 RepID=A0A8T2CK77_ARASU|nr:Band 7/SPFH domain superfamily [Arabidopsis suecica]